MTQARSLPNPIKPWILIAGAFLVSCLAGASVLFANSAGTAAIAQDAAVQVRVQEMMSSITVSRAILSEALVVSVAYHDEKVPESTFRVVLDEAAVLLENLDAQRDSFELRLPDGDLNEALTSYLEAGSLLLVDIEAGRTEDTRGSDSIVYEAAYDRAMGILVAHRDERERHIVAKSTGVGDVADAARFAVAFFIPAAAILFALAFMRRRQARTRLEADIEQDERMRSAKDEFLSAVAHELRTPLTAVVGFAETLRDRSRELSPKDRDELVDILAEEASDTAFMVEDLLVFARANIGDLTVRAGVFQTRDLIEKVAMSWGGRHHGRLVVTGDGMVWADSLRMKQVLRNLLSNAFDHGGPLVECRISRQGPNLRIEVVDNGPGIPAELHSLVFEPYQQGVKRQGQTAPIGLGLTVARSLLRLMEGDLTYQYREGESVFAVTLPAATQEQQDQSERTSRTAVSRAGPSTSEIIETIQKKQFEIVYQPIVDLHQKSGQSRVVGFEALARFPIGSPPEWFGAAWGAGLGIELELAAIRAAVAGFRKAPHRLFLTVNTSMETLTSPNLLDALAGLPPSRIILELSEETVIDNYARAKVYVDRLVRRGYRLAFDDMARGRIDLWYLVRIRPAIVKIDISLVRDIDLEPGKRALVNGLKWLADVLKSRIVAEGIERNEELELLTRLGVHYGQGYLLGRPGPLGNLAEVQNGQKSVAPGFGRHLERPVTPNLATADQ